jgi:hypothetical protein
MKKIYLVLIAFSVYFNIHAQTKFHRYFAQDNMLGILYRCIQTSDGGYAAIGKVTDISSFSDDFLIVKTDADGNPLWIKKITTADNDEFTDIIETSGGGVAVVGSIVNTTNFLSQAVVVQFMNDGTKQWSKTYTVAGLSSSAKKIQKDGSGNLYVLGNVDVSGASTDYFIMKIDADGNIQQQNTYGTPDADFPLAFLRKANGEFYIGGWDNTGTGENIHLLKINTSMSVVWNKLISGSIKYFSYDMKEKSNGNLVLGGRYDDGATSYDPFLMEVEPAAGDVVWAKSYSTADGSPAYGYGLAIGSGDEIAVTGVVEDTVSGTLVFGTGSNGTLNWVERIGGPVGEFAYGYGIEKTGDGGYILCGPRSGNNHSIVQLVKTAASGVTLCNSFDYELSTMVLTLPTQSLTITTNNGSLVAQDISLEELTDNTLGDVCMGTGIVQPKTDNALSVYPNPSDGRFIIYSDDAMPDASLTIFNSLGQQILMNRELTDFKSAGSAKSLDLNLAPGTYLIQLNAVNKHFTHKIIIQ